MPELPEVEVSRQGIAPHLHAQTIANVVVRNGQLRWPVPDNINRLSNAVILSVTRRAKYLLIEVPLGHIVLHLGMSGSLRVVDTKSPIKKHDHVDIVLVSGKCLRLNDPRRFGSVLWQNRGEVLKQLDVLGPEPLSGDFDSEHLYTLSRGKSCAVKTFVMDNKVVVGVGNIYANEALFLSGIDPRRAAGKVAKARYELLTHNIKRVLQDAIKQGGTTLKDFTNADGKPGYFKQQLRVYGREGKPCLTCGAPLKSQIIGQRNTFYCSHCQR